MKFIVGGCEKLAKKIVRLVIVWKGVEVLYAEVTLYVEREFMVHVAYELKVDARILLE